jgi:hypothetical protein
MIRIRIRNKQSDPDPNQIKRQDPYKSEKLDPDPFQKGLDPQDWFATFQKYYSLVGIYHKFIIEN